MSPAAKIFAMVAKCSQTALRTPRADAQRNRERILEIAKKAFRGSGANISLDDVGGRPQMSMSTVNSPAEYARGELSLPVLLVGDLFHPIDHLAIQFFLDCYMRHCRGRRGTVPVLLARREPDHVARPDLLDGAAFTLSPAAAGR